MKFSPETRPPPPLSTIAIFEVLATGEALAGAVTNPSTTAANKYFNIITSNRLVR
jgi:hypothetical protein